MPRGRPPTVDSDKIVEIILMFRNDIILDEKVKSFAVETDPIWKTISEVLDDKIKPTTLHSYVVSNRYSLHKFLFNNIQNNTPEFISDITASSFNDTSGSIGKPNDLGFLLTFSKNEFSDLILETQRQTKNKNGKRKFRIVNILKPQKWTEIVSKKIYDEYRLSHGYHFKSSHISRDITSGGFTGKCKCGSQLNCELLPRTDYEEIVKIKCIASGGVSGCGKRQCRGESRKRVAEALEKCSSEMFRATKASNLMSEKDSIEPPHLYNSNVLRNVKYQSQLNKFRDLDPIRAIAQYKKCDGQFVIRDVGFDPFVVHFWSSHQIRVYNNIMKTGCLCIDATGGIAKRIIHVDGNKSQHIFLYLAVLNCPNTNVAVCGMLSEHQDTVSIITWLMRWIQSGAQYPKEVVCDSSKALLNACCIAFTGCKSIAVYAEACMSDKPPKTKIVIDVAHYIKNWAVSLSSEKKEVKKFYMFCIGQLILCQNQTEATKIIEALLLISSMESAGNGAPALSIAVESMKKLITQVTPEVESLLANSLLDEGILDSIPESQCDTIEEGVISKWIADIQNRVGTIMNEERGDDLNPRYSTKFSSRLLKQLPTIPLWSSICWNNFGYGRVPASSAAVELEFKTLKNQVLKEVSRVDVTLEKIVKYYDGKLKTINCVLKQSEQTIVNNTDISKTCSSDSLISDTSIQSSDELPENLMDILPELQNESEILKYLDDDMQQSNAFVSEIENVKSPLKNIFSDINISTETCLNLPEECSISPQRKVLNEIENWRGLGEPKVNKKSYYLTKTNQDLNDVILLKKQKKLPILKNGNDQSLGLITIKSIKYSVKNTCPIDSLFQIFLSAASDDEKVNDFLKQNRDRNELFDMVVKVAEGKIQQSTYKQRLQIYLKYLKKWRETGTMIFPKLIKAPPSIKSIDGGCNIVSLANYLFRNCASFEERSICQFGCQPRIKCLPSITIAEKDIQKCLSTVLVEHLILPGVKCRNNGCEGVESNEIHRIGNIIVVGVDMDHSAALEIFCKTFVCPKTQDVYKIIGVVEYRGPAVTRRSATDMGHYVAIARRNQNWVVYDDRNEKSHTINDNYRITAELLVYSKL